MRLIVASIAAVAALTISLFPASGAGIRDMIHNQVDNSVEQHNQDVENALGNNNKVAPPVNPGDLKTGWITRKSRDGKDVRLFFAYPAALNKSKPAVALVLVQEEFGVNDEMQDRAKEFATKGIYAVAPDLYNGKSTNDPAEAAKLKSAMVDSLAMTAMKTSLDLLDEEAKNGVVRAERVGVVGWSMGAQQAMLLAIADQRVHAAALFYGMPITDTGMLRKFSGSVLAIYGNDDKAPSPSDVEKFKSAMRTVKGDLTIYQFDGVGHDFATKTPVSGAYNEQKSNEAWANLYSWLDKKLPDK